MTISVLQTASNTGANVTSLAASFASGISAGSIIVVVISAGNGTWTLSTLSDGHGDTATDSGKGIIKDGTNSFGTYVQAFLNPTTGSQTVTATLTSQQGSVGIAIYEVAGYTSAAFDQVFDTTATNTSVSTTTGALAQAAEFALAFAIGTNGLTATNLHFTAGTSVFDFDLTLGSTAHFMQTAHEITAATTALTASVASGFSGLAIWAVTFKDAATPPVNLTGAGMSSGAGSFNQGLSITIASAGVTSGAGALADLVARLLAGASATFAGGTLTPSTPIVLVQVTKNDTIVSSASVAATFASGVGAGSFIVVTGMVDRTATSVTVTNDKGDVVTDSGKGLVDNATVGVRSFCKAFFNPTPGAKVITVTPNVNMNVGDVWIWEFSGIQNPIFDKVQTASDATTAPTTPSTGTLSTANEAAVAYGVSTLAMTAPGSGWTGDGFTTNTVSLGEHRITNATTAFAGTGAQSPSATCQIWVATFMANTGISVNVPGSGMSIAAGSVQPLINSFQLPGVGATITAGTLAKLITDVLTSAGATITAGTLAKVLAQTLAGAGATITAGTLAEAVANALSGAGAAIAAGTIGKTVLIGIPGIGIVSAAAGADITELVLASATTGMTLAAGSFPFGSTNLTGAGATITAGALAKALQDALVGAGATIVAGTLAKALQDALTGAGATIGAGSVGVSAGGNVNLSGASATAAAGTLANIIAVALAGAGLASGAGSFVEVLAKALAGAGLASGAGTFAVSAGNSTSLTLTGAGMTSAAGSLANAIALAVVGAALTSGAGVIIPLSSVVVPLSGAGTASAAGTIGVAITRALAGVGIVSGAGTLIPLSGLVVPLSGAGVTSGAGTIARAVAAALSGVGLTSGVGTLGVTGELKTVALTGVSARMDAGVLTVTISGVTLPVPAERTVAVPFELRVVFAVPSNRAVR